MRRDETYNVLEEVDYGVVITRPAVLRSLGDGPYVAGPGCVYILQSRIGRAPSQQGGKDSWKREKGKLVFTSREQRRKVPQQSAGTAI